MMFLFLVFGASLLSVTNGQVINTRSSDLGHITIPLESTGHLSSLKPFQTVVKGLNSAFTRFYDIQVQNKLSQQVAGDLTKSPESLVKNVTSSASKRRGTKNTDIVRESPNQNGALKMENIIPPELDLLKSQGNLEQSRQNLVELPMSSVAIEPIVSSTNAKNMLSATGYSLLNTGTNIDTVNTGTLEQFSHNAAALPSSSVSVEPVGSQPRGIHASILPAVDVSPSLYIPSSVDTNIRHNEVPLVNSLSSTFKEPPLDIQRLKSIALSEVKSQTPEGIYNISITGGNNHNEGNGMASVRVERTVNQSTHLVESTKPGNVKSVRIFNMLQKNRQNINSKSGIKIEIGAVKSSPVRGSLPQNPTNTHEVVTAEPSIPKAPIRGVQSIIPTENRIINSETVTKNNQLTEKTSVPDPWSKFKTLPFFTSVENKIEKKKSSSSKFNVPQMFIAGNTLPNSKLNTLTGTETNSAKDAQANTFADTNVNMLTGTKANNANYLAATQASSSADTKPNTVTGVQALTDTNNVLTSPLHGYLNNKIAPSVKTPSATEQNSYNLISKDRNLLKEPQYIGHVPDTSANSKTPTNMVVNVEQINQRHKPKSSPSSTNVLLSQSPASYFALPSRNSPLTETLSPNNVYDKSSVSGQPQLANAADMGTASNHRDVMQTITGTNNKYVPTDKSFATNKHSAVKHTSAKITASNSDMKPVYSVPIEASQTSSSNYQDKPKSQIGAYRTGHNNFQTNINPGSVPPNAYSASMADIHTPLTSSKGNKQATFNHFQQTNTLAIQDFSFQPELNQAVTSKTVLSNKRTDSLRHSSNKVNSLTNSDVNTLMKSNELNPLNTNLPAIADNGNTEPILQRIKHAIPETRAHNSAYQLGAQNGHQLDAQNGHPVGAQNEHPLGAQNGHQLGAQNGHPLGAQNGHQLTAQNGHQFDAQNGHPLGAQNGHPLGAQNEHPLGAQNEQPLGAQNGHPLGAQNGHPLGAQNGHQVGVQNGQFSGSQNSMQSNINTMNRLSESILTSNPKLLQAFTNQQRIPEPAASSPNHNMSFQSGLPWIDPPITASTYDAINTTFQTSNSSLPPEAPAIGLSIDRSSKQWSELATNFNSIQNNDPAYMTSEVQIGNNKTVKMDNIPPPPEQSLLGKTKWKKNRERWVSPKELLPNLWSSEIVSLHEDSIALTSNGTATKLNKIGVKSVKTSNSTKNNISSVETKLKKKEKHIAEAIAAVAAKADWLSSPTVAPGSRKKGPWYEPTLANNEIKPLKNLKEKQNELLQVPPEPSIQIVESSSDFFASWDPWNAPKKTKPTPVNKPKKIMRKWIEPSNLQKENTSSFSSHHTKPIQQPSDPFTQKTNVQAKQISNKQTINSGYVNKSSSTVNIATKKKTIASSSSASSNKKISAQVTTIQASNPLPASNHQAILPLPASNHKAINPNTVQSSNSLLPSVLQNGVQSSQTFEQSPQNIVPSSPSNANMPQSDAPSSHSSANIPQSGVPSPHSSANIPQSGVPSSHSSANIPQSGVPSSHSSAIIPQNGVPSSHSSANIPQSGVPSSHSSANIPQSGVPSSHSSANIPQSGVPSSHSSANIPQSGVPSSHSSANMHQLGVPSLYASAETPQRQSTSQTSAQSPQNDVNSPQTSANLPHIGVLQSHTNAQNTQNYIPSSQTSVQLPQSDVSSLQTRTRLPHNRLPSSRISAQLPQNGAPSSQISVQIPQKGVPSEQIGVPSPQNVNQVPNYRVPTSKDSVQSRHDSVSIQQSIPSSQGDVPIAQNSLQAQHHMGLSSLEGVSIPKVGIQSSQNYVQNKQLAQSTGQQSTSILREAYPNAPVKQNVDLITHNANSNYVVSALSISSPSQPKSGDIFKDTNQIIHQTSTGSADPAAQSPTLSDVLNGNSNINTISSSRTPQSTSYELSRADSQLTRTISGATMSHQKTGHVGTSEKYTPGLNAFQPNPNDIIKGKNEIYPSSGSGHIEVISVETSPTRAEIQSTNTHVDHGSFPVSSKVSQSSSVNDISVGSDPQGIQSWNAIDTGPNPYEQSPTISEIVNGNTNPVLLDRFQPAAKDVQRAHFRNGLNSAEVPQQQSATISEAVNLPPNAYADPAHYNGLMEQTNVQSISPLIPTDHYPPISQTVNQNSNIYMDANQAGYIENSAALPQSPTFSQVTNVDPNVNTNPLVPASTNNAYQQTIETTNPISPQTKIDTIIGHSPPELDVMNAKPTVPVSANMIQSASELQGGTNEISPSSINTEPMPQESFPVTSWVASNEIGSQSSLNSNQPIPDTALGGAKAIPNQQSPPSSISIYDNAHTNPTSSTSSNKKNNQQSTIYSSNVAEAIPQHQPSISEIVSGKSNRYTPSSVSSSSSKSLLATAHGLPSGRNHILPSEYETVIIDNVPRDKSQSISEIVNANPTAISHTPLSGSMQHEYSPETSQIISGDSNQNTIEMVSGTSNRAHLTASDPNIGTHLTGIENVQVPRDQYQPASEIANLHSNAYENSVGSSTSSSTMQSSDLSRATNDIPLTENVAYGNSASLTSSPNTLPSSANDLIPGYNEVPPTSNLIETVQTPIMSEIINVNSDPYPYPAEIPSSSWNTLSGGEQAPTNPLHQTSYEPGTAGLPQDQIVPEVVQLNSNTEPVESVTSTFQSLGNNVATGNNQISQSRNAPISLFSEEPLTSELVSGNPYQGSEMFSASNGIQQNANEMPNGANQIHQSSNLESATLIPQSESLPIFELTDLNTLSYQEPEVSSSLTPDTHVQTVNNVPIGTNEISQSHSTVDAASVPQDTFYQLPEVSPSSNANQPILSGSIGATELLPLDMSSGINKYSQQTNVKSLIDTPLSDFHIPSEVMNVDQQTGNAIDIFVSKEPQSNSIPLQSETGLSNAELVSSKNPITSDIQNGDLYTVETNLLAVSSLNEHQPVSTDMRETVQVSPTKERTKTETMPKEIPIDTFQQPDVNNAESYLQQNANSRTSQPDLGAISSFEGISSISNLQNQHELHNDPLKSEQTAPVLDIMEQPTAKAQNRISEPVEKVNQIPTTSVKGTGGAGLANKFSYLSELLSNKGFPVAKEIPKEKPVFESFADLNIAKMMDKKFDPLKTMGQTSKASDIGGLLRSEPRNGVKGSTSLTLEERVSKIIDSLSGKNSNSGMETTSNLANNFENLNLKDSAKIVSSHAFGTDQRLIGLEQLKLDPSSIFNSETSTGMTQHDRKPEHLKQMGSRHNMNSNSITGTAELPMNILTAKDISLLTSAKHNPPHSKTLATNNSIFFDPHTFESINPFAKVTKETIDKAGKVWLDALSSGSSDNSRLRAGIVPPGFHGDSAKVMNTQKVYSDISIIDPVTNGELLRINVPETKRNPPKLPKLGYDPNIHSAPDSMFLPVMFGPIDNPTGGDIEISGPMLAVQVGNEKSPRINVLSPVGNLKNKNGLHSQMGSSKRISKPLDVLNVITSKQNSGGLSLLKLSNTPTNNILTKPHTDMSLPVQQIFSNFDRSKSNSQQFLDNHRFTGKVLTQPIGGSSQAFQMPQHLINVNSRATIPVKQATIVRHSKDSRNYANNKPLLGSSYVRQISSQPRAMPVTYINDYLQRIPQALSVYNRPWRYSSLSGAATGGSRLRIPNRFPASRPLTNYPRFLRLRSTFK